MAAPTTALPLLATTTTLLLLLSILNNVQSKPSNNGHDFGTSLDPSKALGGRMKREKLSHLRLYWHDVVSGPNPTAVMVTSPNRTSASGFGTVVMIDDALTLGPDLKRSKVVGRAQGLYAVASQTEVGLIMAMNFAFIEGKYNGSSISIMGRNRVFTKVREMPIVGGSGLFRFARGYVQASTHSFNAKTGDAVVEYNAYVLHY
ncbi:hypothetical protein Syun_002667 [Stephania yunnanensis]|uniref:Dirigent protein n=1 Tax=Stephania yunnanensis TaxID=152371 RepID=A0AAP0Q7D2_9MAGN